MYNFHWDGFDGAFDEKAYNESVKDAHEKHESALDYVGAVRVGDLCFDLTLIDLENDEPFYLQYDLYVGGIDSGYGYSGSAYPYDYFDGGCFGKNALELSYADFKIMAEKVLTDYINKNDNSETYNLIQKANEPLNIW